MLSCRPKKALAAHHSDFHCVEYFHSVLNGFTAVSNIFTCIEYLSDGMPLCIYQS
jgi:hypothetical protein